MKLLKLTPKLAWLGFGCCGLLVSLGANGATDDTIITSVASKVSDDYVRSKLANGSFQPEGYSFGLGGYWSGNLRDKTIDDHKFIDVATIIAGPLKLQNYVPSHDVKTTRLLIMVYWGTTAPPGSTQDSMAFQNAVTAMNALQLAKGTPPPNLSPIATARGNFQGPPDAENAATAAIAAVQAENAIRRRIDVQNSSMLGYDSLWSTTAKLEGTPLDTRRNDMLDELEENRYFVVLMAYDFQLLLKEKKHKLLWETRFSISERGHEFDRELPAMAKAAARFFGQDSHGLVRKPLQESVSLGELKILGVEPDKK